MQAVFLLGHVDIGFHFLSHCGANLIVFYTVLSLSEEIQEAYKWLKLLYAGVTTEDFFMFSSDIY